VTDELAQYLPRNAAVPRSAPGSAAVAVQRDQRLSDGKVLVLPQIPRGLDSECRREMFGVTVADPGQRGDRRIEELIQALALVRLVQGLI
jgi:hypothetical protein